VAEAPSPRAPRIARAALAILLLSAASIGLVAAFAPHTFYDDFPFLRHWVELLPPYNEHLVTDVGGLYLGFAVIFAWAARTLQPTLVRAVCTAWLLTAALHLGFHATHLDNFDTGDAIGQIASLAFLLVPPPIAIWAVGARGSAGVAADLGE
jgi:ABC-type transporter Mla maintaining outer membrane lipid asymmetry permease subunit MlaE